MKNTNAKGQFFEFLKELFVDLTIVVLLVFSIRTFLISPFRVSGPSMCPTFNEYENRCLSGAGEFVLAWRILSLEHGDIVIFRAPYTEEKEFLIKRVIALPGDELKIENGRVFLKAAETDTFQEIEEPYLSANNLYNTLLYRSNSQIFQVPEDHIFVMGDNRKVSKDSRRCFSQVGCTEDNSPYLAIEKIEGEVKLVIFPFQSFRFIK